MSNDFGKTTYDEKIKFVTEDEDGYLVTIDSVHNEIHEGEMYHCDKLFATVADNNGAHMLIKTSDDDAHFVMSTVAGGSGIVHLYEQSTVTDDGTQLQINNLNRVSENVSSVTAFSDPTISDNGLLLLSRYLPGGTSNQTRIGGEIRQGTEFILKSNSNYVLEFLNQSGSSISVWMAIEFYEH